LGLGWRLGVEGDGVVLEQLWAVFFEGVEECDVVGLERLVELALQGSDFWY